MSIENILKIYNDSTERDKSEGRFWYPYALSECLALAEEFGVEPERVVYAVAAISPRLKWRDNLAAVRAVLEERPGYRGVLPSNLEKAYQIVFGGRLDYLRGSKVEAFAANILGCPDRVTIDGWTARVILGLNKGVKVPDISRIYEQLASELRQAAELVGLEARQLQAIVWVTIRRLYRGRAYWGQLSFDI